MMTKQFASFQEWIDECIEAGFTPSEIVSDNDTYEFIEEGAVMAYWDRKYNFGAISTEVYA